MYRINSNIRYGSTPHYLTLNKLFVFKFIFAFIHFPSNLIAHSLNVLKVKVKKRKKLSFKFLFDLISNGN